MPTRYSLLKTLLDLGHATSQNLEFAHRPDVFVSYGEETITETNLLEIRRRHPEIVHLETFSKKKEAMLGADWEWHIIGRRLTFRMRVQAKRLQRDDKLKIPHKVASSGKQQISLLIADAKKQQMLPVYCFYSAEPQRSHWKSGAGTHGRTVFESGCLLASAHTVKSIMPTSLGAIEEHSVPWHYLVDQRRFEQLKVLGSMDEGDGFMRLVGATFEGPILPKPGTKSDTANIFPTIDHLNSDDDLDVKYEGVIETNSDRVRPSAQVFRERGIGKLIEIDVRDFPPRHPDGKI